MKRSYATVLVAVLVFTAGCSGVFGNDDQPTQTITPAAVPTDEPTPTPAPQLAPGLTGAGIEDADALGAAHRAIVRNRSFVAMITTTIVDSNESILSRSAVSIRSGAPGEGYRLVSVPPNDTDQTRTDADIERFEVWMDGERYFTRVTYTNGTTMYRREAIGDGLTGYRIAYAGLIDILRSAGSSETGVTERLTRNGTELYRVQGNNRVVAGPNSTFEMLVDARGLVHEYTNVEWITSASRGSWYVMNTRLTALNETEPPEPPAWLAEAENRTTPPQRRGTHTTTVRSQ